MSNLKTVKNLIKNYNKLVKTGQHRNKPNTAKLTQKILEVEYNGSTLYQKPPENITFTFGKYKGMTVADASASYLQWLSTQTWVKGKYPEIYNYIASNLKSIKQDVLENEYEGDEWDDTYEMDWNYK